MDKPLLILKPNLINALLPSYVKNYILSLVIVWTFYGLTFFLKTIGLIQNAMVWGMWGIFLWSALLTLIPLSVRIVILMNTKYYFYDTHMLSEFKLFSIKKKSAPYTLIRSITTEITLWDRMCNSGDIVIHTADDNQPNIVLKYLNDPERVEKGIYHLVKMSKRPKHPDQPGS